MTTPKTLGQSAPNAATLTALYTPPGCCRATIDTLTICNRSAVATTFRISLAPKCAADAVAHYLYYDTAIGGNATLNLTNSISASPKPTKSEFMQAPHPFRFQLLGPKRYEATHGIL